MRFSFQIKSLFRVFCGAYSENKNLLISIHHLQNGPTVFSERIGSSSLFLSTFLSSEDPLLVHQDTKMSRADWKELKRISFSIENYHRSLKQHCLVERCQSRRRDVQSAYIALCLCAFVKMEVSRHSKSMSLYEYHRIFFRDSIKRFRRNAPKNPLYGQTHVFCGFQ